MAEHLELSTFLESIVSSFHFKSYRPPPQINLENRMIINK